MALNEDMQNIVKTVYKPIIIYLPERLFPNLKLIHIEELEKAGLFNSLFFLDKNGKSHSMGKGVEYIGLLNKSKILKSNVFQLLEMKDKLAEQTFLYLLKDYSKEIDSWVIVTEIIKNEAKKDTINYNPLYQSYLNFQYQTLVEHQSELKSHFGNWKSIIELKRITKQFGLTTTNKKPKLIVKPIVKEKINTDESQNTKSTEQTIKKVSLSDEVADNYLLKTVFNVKI